MPRAHFDKRFSDSQADATAWEEVEALLAKAELYWLTTVRADGRPHVTPLVGVADGGVMHFATGLAEQKARNLETNSHVALTTGSNTWAQGLDVVVEGAARRITKQAELRRVAAAYEEKYGDDWHFEIGEGVFVHSGDGEAAVFRVEPSKVLAFAKDPHGQTAYRF